MNLNKVFVLGNLTRDPELRQTPNGQTVATFGVATNRVWTDRTGVRQSQAEFHNIVLWGRQAEIAKQYLGKGRLVLIEGRLATRTWQDQNGQKRNRTEIIADRLQLGPRYQNEPPRTASTGSEQSPPPLPEVQLDDMDISESLPKAPARQNLGGDEAPSLAEAEKPEEDIKVEDIPF